MRGGSGRGCARGGLSARRVGGERRWASKLLGRPGIRASAEPVPQRAERGVWQTAARASEGPEAAAAPCAGRSRRRAGASGRGLGPKVGSVGALAVKTAAAAERPRCVGPWRLGVPPSGCGVSGRPAPFLLRPPPLPL